VHYLWRRGLRCFSISAVRAAGGERIVGRPAAVAAALRRPPGERAAAAAAADVERSALSLAALRAGGAAEAAFPELQAVMQAFADVATPAFEAAIELACETTVFWGTALTAFLPSKGRCRWPERPLLAVELRLPAGAAPAAAAAVAGDAHSLGIASGTVVWLPAGAAAARQALRAAWRPATSHGAVRMGLPLRPPPGDPALRSRLSGAASGGWLGPDAGTFENAARLLRALGALPPAEKDLAAYSIIGVSYALLPPSLVHAAIDAMPSLVYAQTQGEMRAAIEAGADWVATDEPLRLLRMLRGEAARVTKCALVARDAGWTAPPPRAYKMEAWAGGDDDVTPHRVVGEEG